ncbi:MAG: GNAT family N-acetyltransferase [Rhodobacteraceae bacterium]|nr:GNAT family N-acetyltransferase [Paracoccaceae bacterium]
MSDSDATFRLATLSDLDALQELYQTHLGLNDQTMDPKTVVDTFKQVLAQPGLSLICAELNSEVIATCTLILVPNITRNCSPYAFIENVVTHKDFRGRGIGEAMMKATIQRAWDAGCYRICLLTGVHNEKAQAFYERVGFKTTKVGYELRAEGFPSRQPN